MTHTRVIMSDVLRGELEASTILLGTSEGKYGPVGDFGLVLKDFIAVLD